MKNRNLKSFETIKTEARKRIETQVWPPGYIIPREEELAAEFGCARTTVNRALRELAEEGLLDRKRKAGTRVVEYPEQKATLSIPIIRLEIENRGSIYGYLLLKREIKKPPIVLARHWGLDPSTKLLFLCSLHLSNKQPYMLEERWINTTYVRAAMDVDFSIDNANEWLLNNTPYSRGDISFSAGKAGKKIAEFLKIEEGDPVFQIQRETWSGNESITSVDCMYPSSYIVHSKI